MKKAKYYYNRHSLRYEKIEEGWQKRLLRIAGFACASVVAAFFMVAFAFKVFPSPKEKQLMREKDQLALKYEQLGKELDFLSNAMTSLQDRDENIYRIIFEADSIPQSVREAGYGGSDRYKHLAGGSNSELLVQTARKLETLRKQLYIQSKSYDEIVDLVKAKQDMLASIPAIQPVSNKMLKRMASGFGMRLHPIYKTRKMHTGVDFSMPAGSEVYATGKGRVAQVERLKRGYGYHVVIDHGYNYETLYAHLGDIRVRKGQRVNRGDVIGFVGNTGTSTSPHLHYEVIKNGKKIDPINFFYNDLTPEEYDLMLEIASRHNQSFD